MAMTRLLRNRRNAANARNSCPLITSRPRTIMHLVASPPAGWSLPSQAAGCNVSRIIRILMC
jgi:hypothetical protein